MNLPFVKCVHHSAMSEIPWWLRPFIKLAVNFFFQKVKQNQPSLCLNSFSRSLPTSMWNLIWCPAFGVCIFKVSACLHLFPILLHVPGTLPSSPTYEKLHDVRNWVCCLHLSIFYAYHRAWFWRNSCGVNGQMKSWHLKRVLGQIRQNTSCLVPTDISQVSVSVPGKWKNQD